MTARRISAVLAVLMLAAATGAEAQTQLRYRPLASTVSYTMADSTTNTVVTPMGEMTTDIFASSAIEMSSAANGDSLAVKAKLTEMKAGMSSMGQSMDMPIPPGWDEEQTVNVSTRGVSLAGSVAPGPSQGTAVNGTASRLFLPLPAGAVRMGESWTDTASAEMDEPLNGTVRVSTTGTWVSDTTVDGRRLHVLSFVTEYDIAATGEAEGVQMSQQMEGRSETTAHFDPQLGANVFISEKGDMKGKVSIPAAGMTDVDSYLTLKRVARLQR